MKKTTYIIAFACALFLVGCESINPEICQDWGKQVHYSDFWFKKFVPDTLYKTLNIDADGEIAQNVELQLYKKEGNQVLIVPTSEVQLFADGAICPNNVIGIHPHTKSIRVGLVFTQEAQRGDYKWYLKVKDGGDVEVLNGYDLTDNASKEIFEWQAKKQVKMNPLANGMTLGGIGLVVLILVWFSVIRFLLYDYFKIAKVNLDTSEKLYTKRVKGLLSLTFTAKRQQQPILERWFVGKRMYVVDSFFETGDIIIVPKNKKSVGIRGVQNYDATSTTVCVNDDPVVIKNPAKQKCEITII